MKASKDEVAKLQTAFDQLKSDARNATEALEGENSRPKGEIEELRVKPIVPASWIIFVTS